MKINGSTLALIAFGISLIFSGGDYPSAVQTGASWGFWISVIAGIFIGIVSLIVLLGSAAGGAAIGGSEGGILGGFLGSLLGLSGGALLVAVMIARTLLIIIITCAGYAAMGKWGASEFENQNALITGCILLGIPIILSLRSRK